MQISMSPSNVDHPLRLIQPPASATSTCHSGVASKGNDLKPIDRLTEMPDDILSFILSFLSIRDSVMARILSRRWRYICPFILNLDFDLHTVLGINYKARYSNGDSDISCEDKSKFVTGVDQFLELYNGQKLNSLRICFCLGNEYAGYVDRWIRFAIIMKTKKLDLDFSASPESQSNNLYDFPCQLLPQGDSSQLKYLCLKSCNLGPTPNLVSRLISLKSLDLEHVPLNQSCANNILSSCLNLEWLRLKNSILPETLCIHGPSLHLKILIVHECYRVEKFEISSIGLTTFEYIGEVKNFSFLDVPRLEKVHIRFMVAYERGTQYMFNGIANDLPRLQTLSLVLTTDEVLPIPARITRFNSLKQLELFVMVSSDFNLLSLTSLLNASPLLQKLHLSLYLEYIQDLLAPEKINIPIVEDPKTGEVTLPGAVVVKIRDLDHFFQLLQTGEANRHAANTKMNTESSRSHAILMVHVRRAVHEEYNDAPFHEKDSKKDLSNGHGIPTVRKSKLLIVDLAGSERLDKSGSEGRLLEEAKFINLSLTSLGKCINALAENSPHIPIRDSKLTRLLRDSFGGSARTSLIVTIGPSSRHHAETSSTIMFGQRAMKVVNVLKLKEEFDYESFCRKLENQVEHLTVEIDRQQKLRDNDRVEMEKNLRECQKSFAEAEKSLVTRSEFLAKENGRLEIKMKGILDELKRLKDHNDFMHDEVEHLEMSLKHSKQYQLDSSTYQKVLADTTQMYEKKIAELMKQLEEQQAHSESAEEQLDVMKKLLSDHQKSMQQYHKENSTYQKALSDTTQMYEKKIAELKQELDDGHARFKGVEEELDMTKMQLRDHQNSNQIQGQKVIDELRLKLQESHQLHQKTVNELDSLKAEYKVQLTDKATLKEELNAVRQSLLIEEKQRKAFETELLKSKMLVPENHDDFEDKKSYMKENMVKPLGLHKSNQSRETISGQRATIAKICEEVGLEKILQLLTSGDIDVQIHAVKVVANLAAEDINQEKIVEEGGLDALLMLLRSSQNTTILRVASGAIANLAMNEANQSLIMNKGGARLLANTMSKTDDPQTLRMVAGAIANLCGNEKLHVMLREDGGIKALLGMVRSGNSDVIAQVARGIANFAKCESRGIVQGHRRGRSVLMEDGVLTWLIANSNSASTSSRRHIELALCHLAQNEDNARDFISSGGAKELTRISVESTREDIRNLAKKTLKSNSTFKAEMHAEW